MSIYTVEKTLLLNKVLLAVETGYLMATGGNVSLRIPDKDIFVITPSDKDYRQLSPNDICVLDFNLNQLEGEYAPSVEAELHCAVYKNRRDVNSVFHAHLVYPSALSLIDKPIPGLFDEQIRFLGRKVDIVPYAPSGTRLLAKNIIKSIRSNNNAYLMKNHGAICFGHDIDRAFQNIELLNKCALAYLLALCTESKVSKIPLPVREIAFGKLRADQKIVAKGGVPKGGE